MEEKKEKSAKSGFWAGLALALILGILGNSSRMYRMHQQQSAIKQNQYSVEHINLKNWILEQESKAEKPVTSLSQLVPEYISEKMLPEYNSTYTLDHKKRIIISHGPDRLYSLDPSNPVNRDNRKIGY